MTQINVEDITSNVSVDSDNVVTGDGVLDKLMETINTHIVAQFDAGRIKGTDIARMYIGIVPSAMETATQFALQKQSAEKQTDLVNEQVKSAERKLSEDDEKWDISKSMMENQKATSDIDLAIKPSMVNADLAQKELMLESAETDIAFNESKRIVMEKTRNDNVRMKAAEQYAEFLKYISAANAVPGKYHFKNLVGLIDAINDGISNEDFIYDMIQIGDRQYDSSGNPLFYQVDGNGDVLVDGDGNPTGETTTTDTGHEAYYKNDSEKSPSV